MPPGGAEVEIAVLFADVRGSTTLAQQVGPRAFAARMNRFYEVATNVLIAHNAIIDKMVGDEVMALFIPGYCGSEYRRLAALSAVEIARAVGYQGSQEPWLPLGVAVHAGPAFVGTLGSSSVTDFTALGDTVNTAARLQGEAAAGEVILSEEVYNTVSDYYPDLERRALALRGREGILPVRVLNAAGS